MVDSKLKYPYNPLFDHTCIYIYCNSESPCRYKNGVKVDIGYAHLLEARLQSINVDWRKLLLQLSPGFEIHQQIDWSGVCWAICRHLTIVLGSTLPRSPGKQGRSVHVCTRLSE